MHGGLKNACEIFKAIQAEFIKKKSEVFFTNESLKKCVSEWINAGIYFVEIIRV